MTSAYCNEHRKLTRPLYYRDGQGSFRRVASCVVCCPDNPKQMHISIERYFSTVPYTRENWEKIQKGEET